MQGKCNPKEGLRKRIRKDDATERSRKRNRGRLIHSGDEKSRVEGASDIRKTE